MHFALKKVVRCCSYVASSYFGTRNDRLDKASDNPYCFPGRYVMTKLNGDNDIFQRVWQ
jgi:hypothetical protein